MWTSHGTEKQSRSTGGNTRLRQNTEAVDTRRHQYTDTSTMVPCIAYLTHDSRLIRLDRAFALPTGVLPIDTRAVGCHQIGQG